MMGDRARRVNSPDGGHAGPFGRFLGTRAALERQPAPCADSAPPLNRSHTRRARHDLPVYHSVRSRYNGSPRLGCASGVGGGRRHELASITGLIVTVRTWKANQEGDKRDVRYLRTVAPARSGASGTGSPCWPPGSGRHRCGTRRPQRRQRRTAPHRSRTCSRHRGPHHRPLRPHRPCQRAHPVGRQHDGNHVGGRLGYVAHGGALRSRRHGGSGRHSQVPAGRRGAVINDDSGAGAAACSRPTGPAFVERVSV